MCWNFEARTTVRAKQDKRVDDKMVTGNLENIIMHKFPSRR